MIVYLISFILFFFFFFVAYYYRRKTVINHGCEYESAYRSLEKTTKECWGLSLQEYADRNNTTIDRMVSEVISNSIPIETRNLNTTIENTYSKGLEGKFEEREIRYL